MFSIFRKKQPAISEIEQFRDDFGIQISNTSDPMSIHAVCNLDLHEFLLFNCKITGFFESDGYYYADKMKEYLISESDYKIRNARFHEQISIVSSKLAEKYDENQETLFNILVVLKEYLDLHYQQ